MSNFKATIIGFFAIALGSAVVYAQTTSFQDACGQYQHLVAALPTTAATPTAKLISGATGRTILVCALHITGQGTVGATPGLTFYSGTGTTCGTGTTQLGQFGQSGTAGVEKDIGSGTTTLLNGGTGNDLCITAVPAQVILGTIEYIVK